jgi:hypothetical protein
MLTDRISGTGDIGITPEDKTNSSCLIHSAKTTSSFNNKKKSGRPLFFLLFEGKH